MTRPVLSVKPQNVSIAVKSEPVKKPIIKVMESAKIEKVASKKNNDAETLKQELANVIIEMNKRMALLAKYDWKFNALGEEANKIQLQLAKLE